MHDDIVKAQKIVSGSYINYNDKCFHDDSFIYKSSNERLRELVKYYIGRKRILSVISSGDQILNTILFDPKVINCFDISSFPKYFLYLKMAAAKALDREEYLDFFFNSITTSEIYDDYYDRIRVYLEGDNLVFWDSLFDYFDWIDIYNSLLFSHEVYSSNDAIRKNIYLDEENYILLKKKIDKTTINTYQGDIMSLATKLKDAPDLAYFSNIIYYVKVKEYLEMLEKMNLQEGGIILSYLYNEIDRDLLTPNFHFDKFNDTNVGVLVYEKKKRGLII